MLNFLYNPVIIITTLNVYSMKIAYYMPFKPLGHPHPSGDLVFGTELYNHLHELGHQCHLASTLRCRWVYLRPWQWPRLLIERQKVLSSCQGFQPKLWLSYHSYYKAPDLLGPYCAQKLNIPYVLFQGIYSTKRKRKLKTYPGYYLNRQTLQAAAMVFTNKRKDEKNLLRLLPPERVQYIPPGIHSNQFSASKEARKTLRSQWEVTTEKVVMTAAMFRPGVKTKGLEIVVKSCGELISRGHNIRLIIAGDGTNREHLQTFARQHLHDKVHFLGKITREELYKYYSAADIFAFPGIEESLGMVYLEAQGCGLPVVAYGDWGGKEAIVDSHTGLLSPASNPGQFVDNIEQLLLDTELGITLGKQGAAHVRKQHELSKSYLSLENKLIEIAEQNSA